ncbi:MAG: O-antigen ligase family protein [Chloroflexi bacterium]|nr:O-antigen ligase family protein [Chloroflexota bacterium]
MSAIARLLLLGAIAAAPFHLLTFRIGERALPASEMLLIAATLAAIPLVRGNLATWLRPRALDGEVLALLLLGALALAIQPWLGDSGRVFRRVIAEPALFYFVVTRTIHDDARRRLVVSALLVGAAAAALHGIAQIVFQFDLITAEGSWRVRGPYLSPNNLALVLDRAIPLAVGTVGGPLVWPGLAILLAAQELTLSIGGWLGTGVGLAVVALGFLRRRYAIALAFAGVVALIGVALASPERVLDQFAVRGDTTTGIRALLWQSSLRMALDHPVLGVGLDNFLGVYSPERAERPYMHPEAWREPNLSHPHNLYLDAWLSLGIGGLALAIWLTAKCTVLARRAIRQAPDRRSRIFALGVAGALAAGLTHGLLDNSYFMPDLALLWMLLFALLAGLVDRSASGPVSPTPHRA